jgi:hypothetical protein
MVTLALKFNVVVCHARNFDSSIHVCVCVHVGQVAQLVQ